MAGGVPSLVCRCRVYGVPRDVKPRSVVRAAAETMWFSSDFAFDRIRLRFYPPDRKRLRSGVRVGFWRDLR